MNYFSLIVLVTASFTSSEKFQFVKFEPNDVKIVTERELSLITLPFEIMPGFHINSDKVDNESLIPTRIEIESADGIVIEKILFLPSKHETVNIGGTLLPVISEKFYVLVSLGN